MKILNYALILLFTLGVSSCGSSGSDSDGTAPEVKFTSPSTDINNPTLITDKTVTVAFTGTISDNDGLQAITFSELVPSSTTKSAENFATDFNEKLNSKEASLGSVLDKSEFPINFTVEPLAGSPTKDYTLTCTVTDKSNNKTIKTFYIKVE